jgi:long-chain acyl-CoA synthetase
MASDPILDRFARLVARTPERPLVVSPRRHATDGDVDGLASAIARRLTEKRLPPRGLAALRAANGPGFLAGWLGVRRAGLVPILHDASTPESESIRISDELGAAARVIAPAWPESETAVHVDGFPAHAERPFRVLPAETGAVKLTSGSTGRPRGVVATSAALAADDAQLAASMGLGDGERLLAMVPLSHSYGLSSLAVPALTRGWPLIVAEERGPLAPLLAGAACGATFLPAVPAWLTALVRLAEPPPLPSTLRLVISAGAPLPAETAARFRAQFGQPVHVFYGASECGGISYDREGGAAERGTVGTPVEGVAIALDSDGRVTVRSAAVATGAIPEDDARIRDGSFLAGDLATWDGGELRLRGRVDDLVIVKGKNVDPREVEAVLRELRGVEDVAVLGVAKPGRGEPTLRAAIACRPGALSYDEVVAWCRDRLAEHKVPKNVVFLAELPRTERGKLDRAALASIA